MSVDDEKPTRLACNGHWSTHSHSGEDILELIDERDEGGIIDIDPIEWSVRVCSRPSAGTHE